MFYQKHYFIKKQKEEFGFKPFKQALFGMLQLKTLLTCIISCISKSFLYEWAYIYNLWTSGKFLLWVFIVMVCTAYSAYTIARIVDQTYKQVL